MIMKSETKKSDAAIKNDVLAELKFEPSVKVTDIGVLVRDGAVTLNGFATSYGEKWDAVRATKRVAGVKAIADDIEVKLPDSHWRTDGDIATAVAKQIEGATTLPAGAVDITVREGQVTLEGEVEWWYQRNAAENAVQHLKGVKGVSNQIKLKPPVTTADIEKAIKSAFERNAILDAFKIRVETNGNKVVLSGKVRNYSEREEAERAAWAAAGVFSVDNQLEVNRAWELVE
jgi:osmotically-inducible protein OsmY